MAGRKLAVNTTAVDEDGRMVTFPAGSVVSAKVAEGITNPKVWGDEPAESERPAGNASTEAWAQYAKDQGQDVEGMSRDEIRALFD